MDAIIRSASLLQEARQLRRAPQRGVEEASGNESEALNAVTPALAINPNVPSPVASNKGSAGQGTQVPEKAPAPPTKPSLFVKPNMLAGAEPRADATAQEIKLKGELDLALAAKRKVEQELAEIRLRSDEDMQVLRAQAERRGYSIGAEKGEQAAKEVLQAQIERLKTLANQLVQSKTNLMAEAEDTMVEIVFTAVCRILGDNIASRHVLLQMVRDCVGETRSPAQVNIRLHPDDLALLQASGEGGLDGQLRLSADASITMGGCIVDSATGSLDARLETQLQRLRDTLLAVRAERRASHE